MRFVTVVFIYTGALLCSLPACSSDVSCSITLDNSVYAFPSHILSDLTNTSSAYVFHVNVVIQLDEKRLFCRKNRRNRLTVSLDYKTISLENLRSTVVSTENETNPFHLIFTVDPKSIFDSVKAKFGVFELYFRSLFDGNCSNEVTNYCEVNINFVQDNPPTVVFETALNVSPRKWINGKSVSDLNGTSIPSPVELEMDSVDNNVEVHIAVNDNDYFVENTEKFEYCAVSEPNITLSAAVTFYNFSRNSNYYTPYNQQLATDMDLNKSETSWWEKSSSKINETHINVRFGFAASGLCSAIHGLLGLLNNSGNLSLERSLEIVVNITLDVTATSGRKNPLQTLTKYILLLRIKGKMLSDLATLSQSHCTVTTAKNEDNTIPSTTNQAAVDVAILASILSVIVLGLILSLLFAFRARIRSCTNGPVPDGRWQAVVLLPDGSSTTAGARETSGCSSITASSDPRRNNTGLDSRHHGPLVAGASAEATTRLIETKQSDRNSSASAI